MKRGMTSEEAHEISSFPAKAGIQSRKAELYDRWVPAFAGKENDSALLLPVTLQLAPDRFRRGLRGFVAAGFGGLGEKDERHHRARCQKKRQLQHG